MADGEYPLDPEHLICNGLGGAFLHPTHVFAHARFAPIAGRDADDAFVHSNGMMPGRHYPGVTLQSMIYTGAAHIISVLLIRDLK